MSDRPSFPTKKAAKEAGYLTRSDWARHRGHGSHPHPHAPRRDAQPVVVKDEEFFHFSDCEKLVSRTEAKRRGLVVPSDLEPVTYDLTPWGRSARKSFPLFRPSDCVVKVKRSRQVSPPAKIDLLLAIYTVNKAAKRRRDAAEHHYRRSRHGLAGLARRTKEELYALKDLGIVAAVQCGRINFVKFHGDWAYYQGEGYSFHSSLVPQGSGPAAAPPQSSEEVVIRVAATPKGRGEARLMDARYTLQEIDSSEEDFVRQVPRRWFDLESVLAE